MLVAHLKSYIKLSRFTLVVATPISEIDHSPTDMGAVEEAQEAALSQCTMSILCPRRDGGGLGS